MKRHFFLTAFLLLFSQFAMAQAPSIPTCDGYDATGAPIARATGSTLCTDYFGSPNWANSPLPAGTILSYSVLSGGSGYINPTVVITDIGPPFVSGTGILKFQDPLPSLAAAVPDTTTFPGADFYVIGIRQYTTQMHANLPPTTLRGYCQLNTPNVCNPSYLGPLIIAQKDRPVRVLFKNLLPIGQGGD